MHSNIPKRVAIITASSNSGRSCIEEIFEKYSNRLLVRAAFRTEEKAKPFKEKYSSLEIVTGVDAYKLDTLDNLFKDCESALIVTPLDHSRGFQDDAKLTENMINSAVKSGVKYIVVVGSWTCNNVEQMPIIANRFSSSEKLLEKLGNEMGLKWTVLRGGCFMENTFHMLRESIIKEKCVKSLDTYLPMVDTRDIGKSAAVCLASDNIDEHHGKLYEMNGPEILSGEDLARIFSKVLGQEIKHIKLPRDALKQMPPPIAQIWEYCLNVGRTAVPFTDDVRKLTGQNITFEKFVQDHKEMFM